MAEHFCKRICNAYYAWQSLAHKLLTKYKMFIQANVNVQSYASILYISLAFLLHFLNCYILAFKKGGRIRGNVGTTWLSAWYNVNVYSNVWIETLVLHDFQYDVLSNTTWYRPNFNQCIIVLWCVKSYNYI